MAKKNNIRMEVNTRREAPRPTMISIYNMLSDWWKGFDERDSSRLPSEREKGQMLMYPIISSIVEVKYLPLLSCHFNVDGDERQVAYVKDWLARDYRRCMKLMLQRAIAKGFAVGERVIETRYIDNKPYWMHVGTFVPDPDDVNIRFSKDKPEIDGFKYSTQVVERYDESGGWKIPGMVYWNYNGDEISQPHGDSILNKLYWPWQLVMKTWTAMSLYQHLHSPFLKMFYAPEKYGDTDNKAVDQARGQAETDLKNIKNARGVVLPLVKGKEQDWVRGPDLDVVAPPDREPSFNDAIAALNTMMYVAVNFPQRMIEQFKDVGAQSLAETQKDFYTQYSIASEVEMHQHFMRVWMLDPMLEVNFGKIDCEIDATVSDEQRERFASILWKLIEQGQTAGMLDIPQIAEKAGIPVETIIGGPTIETAERKVMTQGVEFASTKREDKQRLEAWAQKVVKVMNRAVTELKDEVYAVLKGRLEEQHGKMTLRVERLFRNGTPKRVDLQKAIQIPNSVYAGLMDYVVEAWDTGQRWHCEHAKIKPMSEPSTQIRDRLKTLDDMFTGSDYLMGEGERLESRLYRTLANVRPEDALGQLNLEFDNYIKVTLPIRVQNIVHEANHYGTRDFARHLQLTKAEERRG